LARAERPFWYLLVRAAEPTYEGGELDIGRGRGGYLSTRAGKVAATFSLVPHKFSHSYDRYWFDTPHRYVMVAEFFRRMCEAMDAFLRIRLFRGALAGATGLHADREGRAVRRGGPRAS